jgi:predicted transposase/invertase (TIGR01784 family)
MVSQLDPVINETADMLRKLSTDDVTRQFASSRDMLLRDKISGEYYARKEGRAEGEERAMIKMAEKLLERGDSVDSVLALTGLEYSKIKYLVEKTA